jgi:hypothetical protein
MREWSIFRRGGKEEMERRIRREEEQEGERWMRLHGVEVLSWCAVSVYVTLCPLSCRCPPFSLVPRFYLPFPITLSSTEGLTGDAMRRYAITSTFLSILFKTTHTDNTDSLLHIDCSERYSNSNSDSDRNKLNDCIRSMRRTERNRTERNGTVQNGTVQNGTVRYGTERNGTVQNGTVRYRTNYAIRLASQEPKSPKSHVLNNFMNVEIAIYTYTNTFKPTISFSFITTTIDTWWKFSKI